MPTRRRPAMTGISSCPAADCDCRIDREREFICDLELTDSEDE